MNRNTLPYLLIFSLLFLSGCDRGRAELERQALNLAGLFFFIYAALCAFNALSHHLHKKEAFQKLKNQARIPALYLGASIIVYGLLTWLSGFQASGLNRISIYSGFSAIGLGIGMCIWSKSNEQMKQVVCVKIMSLSMAFFIGFAYLKTKGATIIQALQ